MRVAVFAFILISISFLCCIKPEEPADILYPYLEVAYRFSDPDVAVFSKQMAINASISAVFFAGEPANSYEAHIYRRPLSYSAEIEQVTLAGGFSGQRNVYALGLDDADVIYYQLLIESGNDSVLHAIMQADPAMLFGSPPPQVKYGFNGTDVGFDPFKGAPADFFSVSSDGRVFIIGWSKTGYYYLNFRDREPVVLPIPNAVEAVIGPDGFIYAYVDGSSNIYINSLLLNEPQLIGNGRYISFNGNEEIGFVKNSLFHIYSMVTGETRSFYPPKNVANSDYLMNATLSQDGASVAFRIFDSADSDIVFCRIP
ncbi:MAG: hypothetical protein PHT77_03465 [Bacteroidales bacterium]|nr:hypothetical protein [Bacteroidales bacterium]